MSKRGFTTKDTKGTKPEGAARNTVTIIHPDGPKAADPTATSAAIDRDVKLSDRHGICVMQQDGLVIAQMGVAEFWPYWSERLHAGPGWTFTGAISPKGDIALMDGEQIHAMTPAVARKTAEMLRFLLDHVNEQTRQHSVGRQIAALAQALEQLIAKVEAGEHHTRTADYLGGGRA